MLNLAFNLSLFATFPAIVSRDLPDVFFYPSVGVSSGIGKYVYASFEVGGTKYSISPSEHITVLNSTVGFGVYIGKWNVETGFMATTAGIGKLNINDQSYTALVFRGGYKVRFVEMGVNVPVYILAQNGRLLPLPVPFVYATLQVAR